MLKPAKRWYTIIKDRATGAMPADRGNDCLLIAPHQGLGSRDMRGSVWTIRGYTDREAQNCPQNSDYRFRMLSEAPVG